MLTYETGNVSEVLPEFAAGALVGAALLAAALFIPTFRRLCLALLAAGVLYVLVSLGVSGAIEHANDLVALAMAHPVFFMGLAFGKFVQGLLAFTPLKRTRRDPDS